MLSRRDCLGLALATPAAVLLRNQSVRAQDAPAATPSPDDDAAIPLIALPQPGYDTLRMTHDNQTTAYHVWPAWIPALVTTPDGGGWTFFGAQPRVDTGLGPRRLYGSWFDPAQGVWQPATVMPGNDLQFGPSAVVDSKGVVHVIFTDADPKAAAGTNVLRYVYSDGKGGWSDPEAIAPDANAGYQNMSTLKIDKQDNLHVVWRDQRLVDPAVRATSPHQADLFSSERVKGKWSAPVQINPDLADNSVAGWPQLGVSGNRLVAIWSLYQGQTDEELSTAASLEWAMRPLDGSQPWSAPKTLVKRDTGDIGGRLIDITDDPAGGALIVYGKSVRARNDLVQRRLDAKADDWSDEMVLTSGDYGYLPSIATDSHGDLYVAFTIGRNRNLDVGGFVLPANATTPAAPVLLTPAEDGQQARAMLALDAEEEPWMVYMHQPPDASAVTELRVLRKARFT